MSEKITLRYQIEKSILNSFSVLQIFIELLKFILIKSYNARR